jgi:hypothetical protein
MAIVGLSPGSVMDVSFPEWVPQLWDNCYTLIARVLLDGNQNPDSVDTLVVCTYEYGEIVYDDCEMDAWWVINPINGAADVLAQKFTPYFDPPFAVTKFKIYVHSSQPFDNVRVCPDGLEGPAFDSPFDVIDGPGGGDPPEWLIFEFDTTLTKITSPEPIWLCAQLAGGAEGPAIGADDDTPIYLKSYWTTDLTTWNLEDTDWFMRIVHVPAALGLEEGKADNAFLKARLRQNSPNPFCSSTAISYSLSTRIQVTLSIYDITGRPVETLVNETQQPGIYQVRWNRKDNPSGVYFCRLNARKFAKTRKMVVVD